MYSCRLGNNKNQTYQKDKAITYLIILQVYKLMRINRKIKLKWLILDRKVYSKKIKKP